MIIISYSKQNMEEYLKLYKINMCKFFDLYKIITKKSYTVPWNKIKEFEYSTKYQIPSI